MTAIRYFELNDVDGKAVSGLDGNNEIYTAVSVRFQGRWVTEDSVEDDAFWIMLPPEAATLLAESVHLAAAQATAVAQGRNN